MPIATKMPTMTSQATPPTVFQRVDAAALCMPSMRNMYCAAICTRLAMTMTDEATAAKPMIQPSGAPKAREVQMKVSPQSGSALVHVEEAGGHEQHGHEAGDEDERRPHADALDRGQNAERSRQAVGGRHRGDADDHAGEQAKGPRVQPFGALVRPGWRRRRDSRGGARNRRRFHGALPSAGSHRRSNPRTVTPSAEHSRTKDQSKAPLARTPRTGAASLTLVQQPGLSSQENPSRRRPSDCGAVNGPPSRAPRRGPVRPDQHDDVPIGGVKTRRRRHRG